MKRIQLTQGKFAVVDDADHARLNAHKWYATKHNRRHLPAVWYANRDVRINGVRTIIGMHREVVGVSADIGVDHIDRDGLNNQRSNLRPATQSQNSHNCRARSNVLGFRGVCRDRNKYRGRVNVNGRTYYAGSHATPEAAARARDFKARELMGAFATTNFAHEELLAG